MCGQSLDIHLHLTIDLLEKMYLQASPQPRQRGRVVHGRDEHTIAGESVFHVVHVRPSLPPNVQDNITLYTTYAGIFRDSITYHAFFPAIGSTFGTEREICTHSMGSRHGFYWEYLVAGTQEYCKFS